MNKEELSKTLSISCVENYFLVWIAKFMDKRALYFSSFVPAGEIINDFINGGADYSDYNKIKRIQDIAEEAGITSHKMYNELLIEKEFENLVLIRINKTFFKNSKLIPWRPDHYICITAREGSGFKYINNYPLRIGEMNLENLQNCFDKSVLVYSYKRFFSECFRYQNEKTFITIINSAVNFSVPNVFDLKKMRDALGIIKISRKRIFLWLKFMAMHNQFIFDREFSETAAKEINLIEKLYLRLELSVLRNNQDFKYFHSALDGIMEIEKKIPTLIKMRRIADEKIRYI